MIEGILDMNGILYTVIVICIISLIFKLQLALLYNRLIREAAAPGKNRKCRRYVKNYIREILNGFESEYRSSYYVNNVSVYVDKYLYDIRMYKVRYSSWETMGVIAMILCLATGMSGAFGAYYYDMGQEYIIRYVIEGLVSSAVIVVADAFFDIQRKKEQLHANISNYLENYMRPRLERGDYSYRLEECARLSDEVDAGMMALIESLNNTSDNYTSDTSDEVSDDVMAAEKRQGIGQNGNDGDIIEDVIREYLN